MSLFRLKKHTKLRKATTKDINRVLEWLDKVLQFNIRGKGVMFRQGPDGIQITIKDTSNKGIVRTAKTTEAWQPDGTVNVNFLDSNGDEMTTNPVDVFILLNKSATDVTSGYWPVIANDQIVSVFQDAAGDWILDRPDVQLYENC